METFGKKYRKVQVILKSIFKEYKVCFKNSVLPELALFSSAGPAVHFLLVHCGPIADMKTAHHGYHQFSAACQYTCLNFAQAMRSFVVFLSSGLKSLGWSGKIWQP